MFMLIPTECNIKSKLPPKCSLALVIKLSISSLLVTSHGTMGAFIFSASLLISPIRMAIGALVSKISAPSSWHFNAVIHAMDLSSNAPKIIPLFPFNKLYDIVFNFLQSTNCYLLLHGYIVLLLIHIHQIGRAHV